MLFVNIMIPIRLNGIDCPKKELIYCVSLCKEFPEGSLISPGVISHLCLFGENIAIDAANHFRGIANSVCE
jgi:hypothetical protein